jgi:hypothetical protein
MLGKRAGREARQPVTTRLCADLLYGSKAARRAARAADSPRSSPLPQRRAPNAGRLSPKAPDGQGHGGFDKGTPAAARIGLKRACQEAARSQASV